MFSMVDPNSGSGWMLCGSLAALTREEGETKRQGGELMRKQSTTRVSCAVSGGDRQGEGRVPEEASRAPINETNESAADLLESSQVEAKRRFI